MKQIALILDQSFPDLDDKMRSKLHQILKYLPCLTLFYTKEEDGRSFSNYSQQYDIQKLQPSLLENYQYQVILHDIEEVELTTNQYAVTFTKYWKANLLKVLREILVSDWELLVQNMELMSKKNFVSKFYKWAQIVEAITLPFSQIVNISKLDDYRFMLSLEGFLKSEDQHLALMYNPRYYSKKLFYHTLHKSILDSRKDEKLLFAEVEYVSKKKSLVFRIKNSLGPDIELENIKQYLKEKDKELLLVINYRKIDQSKIEQIWEIIWDQKLDLPYKMIHLISEDEIDQFSEFNFDQEEELGKLNQTQVLKNISQSFLHGKLDQYFILNNPNQLELLRIPTLLRKSVNMMQSRLFGFSSVFPDYFYKSVLTKYCPAKKRKGDFVDDLVDQMEEELNQGEISLVLELNKVDLKAGDQEFEAGMTYLVYAILKRNGWKEYREQLEFLRDEFPLVYLWSNTLYLADLVREKKIDDFMSYLLWNFDEQLISSLFRFNTVFQGSKYGFLIELTGENPELGFTLQKIVVKDFLQYGFYGQAYYLVSHIKKFFAGEQFDLLTKFSKQLRTMARGFGKFDEVEKDDYFKLYEYYLEITEYKQIEEMLNDLPADSSILYMELNQQTKNLTDSEKIIIRELFYKFIKNNFKKMSLEVAGQCMKWYGEFCMEENFLNDYAILIGYLYEKMIYSGQNTSKMELSQYKEAVIKIKEKLQKTSF